MHARHLICALLLAGSACSAPSSTTPDSDTGRDASVDAAIDSGVSLDGGDPDTGPVEQTGCAAAPAIVVAGTPETDAVANAAARCGQAPHTWLRDATLGDVTGWGTSRTMRSNIIQSLAENEGLVVPPLEHDVEVRQFSYLTQDRGASIEATALVALPLGLEAGEERGIVVFLHGTTGLTDACAPSDDLGGQLLASLAATQGYIVVAPDYIGMKGLGEPSTEPSPYLVGQPTAMASLDAVRAVLKMSDDDRREVCPTTDVAVWGVSQGGHAALWIQRLAPYYARELNFVGGVAAVPATDLVGQAELALSSLTDATSNVTAMLGAAAASYGGDPAEIFVPPYDVNVPDALLTDCGASVISEVTAVEELFTPLLLDAVADGTLADVPVWGCALAENSLTTTSIPALPSEAPLLFMVAEEDSLIIPSVERAGFAELCAQNVPLDYLECAGEDHVSANLATFDRVFAYLAARIAGEPWEGNCAVVPAESCAP